jgi:hypothetical protein
VEYAEIYRSEWRAQEWKKAMRPMEGEMSGDLKEDGMPSWPDEVGENRKAQTQVDDKLGAGWEKLKDNKRKVRRTGLTMRQRTRYHPDIHLEQNKKPHHGRSSSWNLPNIKKY